jgi:hypothetical protein
MAIPPSVSPLPVRSEPEASHAAPAGGIGSAIADLYRACHLPHPALLVARDAVHFAQLACRIGHGSIFRTVSLYLYLALLLPPLGLAFQGDEMGAAFCGFIAVIGVPWVRSMDRPGCDATSDLPRVARLLLITLLIGATVAGLCLLGGFGWPGAVLAAGSTLGTLASLQILGDLLSPVWSRLRLRRESGAFGPRLGWWAVLRGATPARSVVLPRLVAALAEAGATAAVGPKLVGTMWRSRGEAERQRLESIEAELHRLGCRGDEFVPLLGHSGRPFEPGAQVSALAAAEVEHEGLPRLLRAAVVLDGMAEAVSVFHGVALVLPLGASPQLTPAPVPLSGRWRRSRRAPWWPALQWVDEAAGLAFAIDLAPTEGLADLLVARRLRRLPEARRRTPAIQAMGTARFMAALRPRPVQEDARARLYQIGRDEDPSVFVAVRDGVLAPDGTELEDWISVPPHVATAREAVAWSFGMSEAEYRSSREA